LADERERGREGERGRERGRARGRKSEREGKREKEEKIGRRGRGRERWDGGTYLRHFK